MFKNALKYLLKLLRDRVLHKTILNFAAFALVLTGFVYATNHHYITRSPQPMVPQQYAALSANAGNVMNPADLERGLRLRSSDIQGLVFFKGLDTIVVLGNGLEHDKIISGADTDEMRKLADANHLAVADLAPDVSGQGQDLLPGGWYLGIAVFVCWGFRLLFFRREKNTVRSRIMVFFSAFPVVMAFGMKVTKTKPSKFYPYLLAALVALDASAFMLRLYHDNNMYVLPASVASAQRIQPWQATRHLNSHADEFQRVTVVKELNSVYMVLNSASAVNVKAKDDFSDDDDFPLPTVPAISSAGSGVPTMTVGGRGGVRQVPVPGATAAPTAAPAPAPVAPMPTTNAAGDKLKLVYRTVEFGKGAAAKADFNAFVATVQAKKIDSKSISADHETGFFDSLSLPGRFAMSFMALLIISVFVHIVMRWSDWKEAENPRKSGDYSTGNRLGIGGITGSITGNNGNERKPVIKDEDKKTFADVAGCQEAIDELQVVKKKIMRPRLYKVFGAPTPNGVILWGPPGTGKTLLARALAGEVGGSFQIASGSEFVEMYVGVGAKRIRELYAKARADASKSGRISIVFIDEIDALAKKRGTSTEGGNREYEQTLNQLLVEMNGFENHGMVLTMAATNRLDVLDEAILRPGRFDIKVKVPKPDRKGRGQIFRIYLKKLKIVLPGVSDAEKKASYDNLIDNLARRSHDFSGAEIEGCIKDGATIAVEREFGDVFEDITEAQAEEYRNKAIIMPQDLDLGIDKMQYGTQIRSRIRTDAERWATAVHEIGHAMVPTVLNGDKVNRITIVMTDKSLGLMDSSPEEGERYDWTDVQFVTRLKMMLAGRAAEKVILQKISTGASNDFERASQLARSMVGVYGMSEAFGNKSIPLDQHGFPASNIGETMMVKFNDAWGSLIDQMQTDTEALVEKHKAQIKYCARRLFNDETLTGDEFRRLFGEELEALKEEAADQAAEKTETNPNGETHVE